MVQIKGKLTQVESEVDSEHGKEAKRHVPDYRRSPTVYDIKSNGCTVDWVNNPMQAVKFAKEINSPAIVYEIRMQTGIKKVYFKNDRAITKMAMN